MALPRTYSVDEVVESIGCSRWWLSEAVRHGRVPHVRLSRTRIRFTEADVEAALSLFHRRPGAEPHAVPEPWGLTPRSAAHMRRTRPRSA